MSAITPFGAWRPEPHLAYRVAAPPYDVLSSDEARNMARGNPYSFLHVSKPEIDFPPEAKPDLRAIHARGAENFRRLVADGVMIRDPKPCFYVYRQRKDDHVQAGFVAGASCEEYRTGRIKRHELTRPDKVEDRLIHIESVGAQTGPVFLAFKSFKPAESLLAEAQARTPIYQFSASDEVEHTVWVIDDPVAIGSIREAFSDVPFLYIADGHHRSEAASQLSGKMRAENPGQRGIEPCHYFLSVIFPASQLRIMDYNRVVKDLGGMDRDTFLRRLADRFIVSPTEDPRPPKPKTMTLHLGGRWYRLEARPGTYPEEDPVRSLDVSVLQENVLSPLLGIENPRTDARIDFVGGIRGLKELETRCDSPLKAAFALFPTSMNELMRVADAGLMMPPKSTWFEPKLRSGLLVRSIRD